MTNERKQLLEEANRKLYQNNTNWEHYYRLPIEDFILLLYSRCSPSVYGVQFEKKLLYDLRRLGLPIEYIPTNKNAGDYELHYPPKNHYDRGIKKYRPVILMEKNRELIVGCESYKKKRIEVKFSFLGKNNHYTIRNIRPWQEFDYLLIVFVDTYNDFKLMFSLVSKEDFLRGDFTFSAMNGTYESNSENKNVPLGCVIKDESYVLDELMGNCPSSLEEYNLNLLDGTTIDDLKKFLCEDVLRLKDDFISGMNDLELHGEKLNLNIDEVYELNKERDDFLHKIIDGVKKDESVKEIDPEVMEMERKIHLLGKLNKNMRGIKLGSRVR